MRPDDESNSTISDTSQSQSTENSIEQASQQPEMTDQSTGNPSVPEQPVIETIVSAEKPVESAAESTNVPVQDTNNSFIPAVEQPFVGNFDSPMAPVDNTPEPLPQPVQAMDNPFGGVAAQPGVVGSTSSMSPMPASTPQKKSNIFLEKKKLFIGIAAALVVLIVAAVVALNYFTVSKADYRAAYTIQEKLLDDYNSNKSLFSSVSSKLTNSGAADLVKSMNENVETIKGDIKKLGDNKAIKLDSELQSAYKALNDKLPKFDEAVALTSESLEKIVPALTAYSSTSLTGTYEQKTQAAIDAFSSLTGFKFDVNTTFANSAKAAFDEALPYAKKIDAYKVDFSKYESGVLTKYYDALKKYSDSIKVWQTGMEVYTTSGEIKNEINTLSDIIYKKVN